MSKTTKTWLIIATSFVVFGLTTLTAVMAAYKWDFTKLSTVKYETNTYEMSEAFNNISIDTKTADILFVTSDDGTCKVDCYEQEKVKHSATVKDNTLTISTADTREWYEYIGITIGTPKITVYLPQAEYDLLFIEGSTGDIEIPKDFKFENINISASTGDVKCYSSVSELITIKLSTGDIRIENVSAGALELSVSTGEVIASSITCEDDFKVSVTTGKTKLTDVACKSITSSGTTGAILLKNVIATDTMSVNRSTGDVKFNDCDAGEIYVKTNTGNITGTLLSEKVFIANTDTGRVNVPKTITGGRCEINSNTGDIKIDIS